MKTLNWIRYSYYKFLFNIRWMLRDKHYYISPNPKDIKFLEEVRDGYR